jgi:hypothetical protein
MLQVTTFAELFEYSEPWKRDKFERKDIYHRGKQQGITVSHYCLVTGPDGTMLPSLFVRPTVATLDWVADNMLAITYDSIYFAVYVHNDGHATVYAKNNQILGSRMLAVISADTVPQY